MSGASLKTNKHILPTVASVPKVQTKVSRNHDVSCGQAATLLTCSSLFSAAINAGLDAGMGAAGAAILNLAGHEGFDVAACAKMGAVGGAIIGGASGFLTSGLILCGIKLSQEKAQLVSVVLSSVVNGLVGYGIFNSFEASAMTAGTVAASFAVGSAVVMGSAICCCASISSTANVTPT